MEHVTKRSLNYSERINPDPPTAMNHRVISLHLKTGGFAPAAF